MKTLLKDPPLYKVSSITYVVPLLVIFGLLIVGCNFIEIGSSASSPSESGIIFVTVTPESQITLNEGQRSLAAAPTPPPTPAPYFAGANELGKIMVLQYHRFGYPEQRFQRSPDNFRSDLQRLYEGGYYPVNFIDLVNGLPDVPPGKKPVVLTFDDSDISQFRVMDDNSIDANSAVGLILNFHNQYPQGWPPRATFFVLGDDTASYASIFGQPKWAEAKLQLLVEQGMEVGSHTVKHTNLATATAERISWELAVSQHVLEQATPGYTVQSLAMPYGEFPYTTEFLKAGEWDNFEYTYAANAAAWGGATVSPFDPTFDPYRVSRIEVTGPWLDYWLTYFEQNPHDYYVSDGDPKQLTFHQTEIAAEQ